MNAVHVFYIEQIILILSSIILFIVSLATKSRETLWGTLRASVSTIIYFVLFAATAILFNIQAGLEYILLLLVIIGSTLLSITTIIISCIKRAKREKQENEQKPAWLAGYTLLLLIYIGMIMLDCSHARKANIIIGGFPYDYSPTPHYAVLDDEIVTLGVGVELSGLSEEQNPDYIPLLTDYSTPEFPLNIWTLYVDNDIAKEDCQQALRETGELVKNVFHEELVRLNDGSLCVEVYDLARTGYFMVEIQTGTVHKKYLCTRDRVVSETDISFISAIYYMPSTDIFV